jgi:hypothetical protein
MLLIGTEQMAESVSEASWVWGFGPSLGLLGTAQDDRPGGRIGRKGDNLSQTRSTKLAQELYIVFLAP